jgi:nucleolar complex protein 3
LSKPARALRSQDDDLPSIHSHSEDEGLWDSDVEGYLTPSGDDDAGDGGDRASNASVPSHSSSPSESLEVEDLYERKTRNLSLNEEPKGAERLPVKLPNGEIKKRGFLPVTEQFEESDNEGIEAATAAMSHLENKPPREDISTGARFGRPAVTAVIGNKSRKARIQGAKEQLANICQDIVADPENNVRNHCLELIDFSSLGFTYATCSSVFSVDYIRSAYLASLPQQIPSQFGTIQSSES